MDYTSPSAEIISTPVFNTGRHAVMLQVYALFLSPGILPHRNVNRKENAQLPKNLLFGQALYKINLY
jgi:hypothetical protein